MLILISAVAAAVGVVAVAAVMFKRRGTEDRAADGVSASHSGAMLSALFLLVFAIAIIVPWTTADAARQNTYTESQAAIESYWAAAELPNGDQIRTEIDAYVRFVVHQEWPRMAQGELSVEGTQRLNAIRDKVNAVPVSNRYEADDKDAALQQIASVSAARSQRAADAGTTPPPGLVPLTIVTGVLVLLFPFMAGARPRGMALVPLFSMAVLIGFGVYVAADITRPFAGSLKVQPEAFNYALSEFKRISAVG